MTMAHLPQWKSIIAMDKKRKGRKMPFSYLFPRGIKWQRKSAAGFSHIVWGTRIRGIFSFSKENIPLTPPRERIFIASEQLEELQCLPIAPLACGRAAFGPAIRFASVSTTRCRSAHLIEVQPNSRLPPVSTMRRAKQCHIRHAVCRRSTVTRASR